MDLSGKLLIAMPALADPRFARAVVLLCHHSAEGAMGLIVNKPLAEPGFAELLDHIGVAVTGAPPAVPVHFGGPVEPARGFVLHDGAWQAGEGTMSVPGGFAMTATQDILVALAGGTGPAQALMALGYAGWGGGQLEGELARNDWLTVDATPDLVFAADNPAKWHQALAALGIDPRTLASSGGRA